MDRAALDFRRLGRALLNQQVWCWGQDVLRPEGNGLLQYGMTRLPPPRRHKEVPSIYVWNAGNVEVILRGFGIGYEDQRLGRIFIRRYGFSPAIPCASLDWHRLWFLADLCDARISRRNEDLIRVWRLCADCCAWIEGYERWVQSKWGVAYRKGTLAPWEAKRGRLTTARSLATAWQCVGAECRNQCDQFRRRHAG